MSMGGFLILWVTVSIVVGVAAARRGRSFGGWLILALLISPILALLLLIAFPAIREEAAYDDEALRRNIAAGRRLVDLGLKAKK
jgi:biotin transporter BioY